jgi:hypothetical protein
MIQQRCFNHEFREAASRCPICRRYFCRECVTEHEDRVLCVKCLRKEVARQTMAAGGFRRALSKLLPVAGLLMAWLFFYVLGRTLLSIPVAVHDGTLWGSSR